MTARLIRSDLTADLLKLRHALATCRLPRPWTIIEREESYELREVVSAPPVIRTRTA